ncbi:MAG: response regulator transcription factor [Gemmatimonadota bacterium]|nr:MAG: response regulator transcription factor [Gemmatimonadota bacterium]
MSMRTIIVDDEAPARLKVKQYLKDNPDIEIIGEADNGTDAVREINEKKPDLVILDIQMPEMDGFEVIKALSEPPLVIFATAYDQYAIQAFEVNSIDYLLKPFSKQRLKDSLERAKGYLKSDFESKIEDLLKLVEEEKKYLTRIPVRKGKRIIFLDIKDVVWIGAEETLNFVYTKENRYLINDTLAELEEKLDPQIFFRIHRSSIINLNHVVEIVPWFAGQYKVVMKDREKTELTLSRRRVKSLKEIFPW